jgi:CheY-like chemotaxis protein
MTDELLSLCAVVVSPSPDCCRLLRQAAVELSTPVEVVEAENAAAACRAVGSTDYIYLDASLPSADCSQVVSAARAATKPPFTVMLTATGTAHAALTTDAVAIKPVSLDEAKHFFERAIRIRLPSRVLIVDDSSTMRSIVRKILSATRFPFEFSEADEGQKAIKSVSEAEFDIVFLDYHMPGLSGLETLSAFKREGRRITVVVMTSAPDQAISQRVRDEGAAFLKKPFYPADIEAVLAQHYGLTALNPKRA